MSAALENKTRSLLKAVSYRVLGASVTAAIALILTGQASLAATFGFLDFSIKIGCYYAHERLWERIPLGRTLTGGPAPKV